MNDQQTVFLVDDEPRVLRAISRLLKAEGYRIESFRSGREFMEKYNPDATGCLVIDVSMPEFTGLQVQQWLVRSGIRLPVILLTGLEDNKERMEAISWGAVDVLAKPVTSKELIGCIEEAFAGNRNGILNQQPTESLLRATLVNAAIPVATLSPAAPRPEAPQ